MTPRRGRVSTGLHLPLILFVGGFSAAVPASAQERDAAPSVGDVAVSSSAPSGVLGALGTEARLYLDDASALLAAPFHWGRRKGRRLLLR
jgi:hypothetical protein